ncbi:hypothetical protein O181_129199 [Austropuccinia psidii MF-1]|uniref:Uncharacterized protein n=1 Tax=Austropuccinia psidii MF-1 TaxID=1389203 RepID=A0A9Q3KYM1_9BASI|nr:hypothetical protein [Austropuccinia psidii MF-1]
MPSTRSGARYKPSRNSQKGHRRDYGTSQSDKEGQGLVKDFQNNKLSISEPDDTILPSKRSETPTRSLSGEIQSHPEGLKQCTAAQRVPDPCRSVEKLHKFIPDSEWRENNPPPPNQVPRPAPGASSSHCNVKKQPQAQNKGKGRASPPKPYSQGYRIPKIQQDAMENVFQMARIRMELQREEEARLKLQK